MRDVIYSILTATTLLSTAVLFMLKLTGVVVAIWQVFIPTFATLGIIFITELALLVKKVVKHLVYKYRGR